MMNSALAYLQNERQIILRKMLANRRPNFSFAGHPWSNSVRDLHDAATIVRITWSRKS